MRIVLGSSSRYRKELLERLGIAFTTDSPDIDETPSPGEAPRELSRRLTIDKARAVGSRHTDTLVIASDQVGEIDGVIVGKPGNYKRAHAQLTAASGKTMTLHTGLSLLNTRTGHLQTEIIPFSVRYRVLKPIAIQDYLNQEQPYDCTGALRAEGPGIALLDSLDGTDPSALIGLPLITLVSMLEAEGVVLFGEPQ